MQSVELKRRSVKKKQSNSGVKKCLNDTNNMVRGGGGFKRHGISSTVGLSLSVPPPAAAHTQIAIHFYKNK